MAGIPIPPEMLPRMDWHAEDKSAAWEHFTTRLKLYYTVAHTPKEVQVDTILFFVGTEATDRWKTLKEQMSAEDQASSDKVFEAFANSFEKSSSYWQAREEYLSDIKQNKQQTMAELDIYIKNLVRRCQFTRNEVEARKIDLLYHAMVHFEVRKFVHNAKAEELTYDRMIEVAKAHERTCHEYQQHKQAHSVPVSSYQNPLIQTNAVRKSFQKTRSCGKCGQSHPQEQCPAHGKMCHSCGRKGHWTEMCRTRRNSSTGCTPSPHPPNRQRRPSGGKPFKQQGGGGGKGSGKFFKKDGTPNKHKKGGAPPKKTHSLKLVISEEETVSNRVGISGPTHPPEEKYPLSQPQPVPKLIIRHYGDTAYDSYICRDHGSTEECLQAQEADQVRERPSDQCQTHSS